MHVEEERQIGLSAGADVGNLCFLADPVVKEQSQPCAENTVLSSGLTAAR